eukprot:372470-Hanusia_phi.AAC.1
MKVPAGVRSDLTPAVLFPKSGARGSRRQPGEPARWPGGASDRVHGRRARPAGPGREPQRLRAEPARPEPVLS